MSLPSTIQKTLASVPKHAAALRLASHNPHLRHPIYAPSHTGSPHTARAMSSLPSTMSGVSIPKNGGVEVLEFRTDLPVPTASKGSVIIKNDFLGVNYIDTYFRTGLYPCPSFPYVLGREGAGTIVATGEGVSGDLKEGERAVYLGQNGYAEYTEAPATHTYKIPDGVDNKMAAAALLQGLTGITLVREAYKVQKGDWILVHAAAGGMGLWLCQLLKAIGARTIGTASTAEKRELASKAGAEVVMEYPENMGGHDAFVSKVKDLTGGEGVACVFDGVGKATFDVSLDCIKRNGSMISFGNASGAVPPLTISRLTAKNIRLMRTTLFNFIATREEFERYASDLFDMVGKGQIDVAIHKVYELKDIKQAHTDIESRGTTGKLVLKV